MQFSHGFGKRAQKSGDPSKLHSVYVSGYVLTLTEKVLKDVLSPLLAEEPLHNAPQP